MDFITKLSTAGRIGLTCGLMAIVLLVAGFGYWALRTEYIVIVSELSPEKTAAAAKALDAQKIPYRISGDGSAIEVIEKDAGKARSELAASTLGLGTNQGFELFNNTDFSATDFSQRINFQRALQGELTRTIQSIDGVTAARVHLVLPEGSGLRRRGAKATAAIAISLAPGKTLLTAQVKGIQRLVAAAVPEIKLDDVTVIDFSGTPLSRAAGDDTGMSSAQLELKRDADNYFETKLNRLLSNALPHTPVTVSVDVALNFDQLKVTTEQALPVRPAPEGERDVGVVVKERQVQRIESRSGKEGTVADPEVLNLEIDYKVGQRIEQSLQTPGGIKRLSVAVVVHGQPTQVGGDALVELIGNAVGMVRARGDAISIIMLPPPDALPSPTGDDQARTQPSPVNAMPISKAPSKASLQVSEIGFGIALLAVIGLVLLCGWAFGLRSRSATGHAIRTYSDEELDRLATQVKAWLREGSRHAG